MIDVTGTVVDPDGNPIERAELTFTPEGGGRGSVGSTDANGRYTLLYTSSQNGAIPGKHSVSISIPTGDNSQLTEEELERGGGSPPVKVLTQTVDVSEETSEIDFQIDQGGMDTAAAGAGARTARTDSAADRLL